MRRLTRLAAYFWASPNTVLGLLLVALALASRGRAARVAGTIEAHGGCLSGLLARWLPPRGGVDALALGHVILGDSAASLERNRAHERAHVRQCERWGPLFIPAYLCASLWAWTRGRDAYLDNRFERDAMARALAAQGRREPPGPRA